MMIKFLLYTIILLVSFFLKNILLAEAPKNLIINDLKISDVNLEVELNDKLFVHYEGWVYDKSILTEDHCSAKGIKFDSSKEKPFRETPNLFTFTIGKGLLIPGWELGLLKMKKGSIRCLVIPHQLAYGHRSFDKIPPYSTLIFEIELINIKKNKQDFLDD